MIAVVASAFLANAAAVDWYLAGDSSMKGYTAYAILGDTVTTSWESLTAVQAAAISEGGSGTFAGSRTVFASGSAVDSAITKSNADIYFVIVDNVNNTFAVTTVADMSAKVYDAANQETSPGNFEIAATGLSYSAFGGSTGGDTPAVPEPTSGLLMLVGLGALALRRRRA